MIDRSHVITPERELDASQVQRLLAHEIGQVLSDESALEDGAPRFARVEVAGVAVDPFRWLDVNPSATKLYWSGRDPGVSTAALGAAHEVSAEAPADQAGLEALIGRLADAPAGVRYFGGARFDSGVSPDAAWTAFGAFRFVLPRFELVVRGEETVLACNLVFPRDRVSRSQLLAEIRHLRFPVEPLTGDLPFPVSRSDEPGRDGWVENVRWALDAFSSGTLDKVVLARKAAFGFAERVSPFVLLRQLQAVTPGCHHFLFQPDGRTAFLGASPERLFFRNGREVSSEAVAGTRPRGRSAYDDERLRDELLHSEKDLREHAYVRLSIGERLGPLCEWVDLDENTSEMMLARGRHLYSGVRGLLKPNVTDVDLLRALHPTPAVGGYPREEALRAIRERERFDRGWYAGPVGWIGADQAEFAVAIRSGLVREEELSLFSGAGIVSGSVPESEYDEVEQKLSDFLRVLGLDNGRT